MSFIYFKQNNCDIAVIEVGLGGKLDASNVIESSFQIITNIGLDHMKILGDTKELILLDKQEIIKEKSIVVSGIQEINLQDIISTRVKHTNSSITFLNKDFKFSNLKINQDNTSIFNFETSTKDLSFKSINNIKLSLPGIFQVENSVIAIQMALNLKKDFESISQESIKLGLLNANIKGRLEIVSKNPLVIIDGAHNPSKFLKLKESLDKLFYKKKFIIILRFKRRDDFIQSINILKNISYKIIITGSKRAEDMGWDELYSKEEQKQLKLLENIDIEPDLKMAIHQAKTIIKNNINLGILITGSIYMIKESLDYIESQSF